MEILDKPAWRRLVAGAAVATLGLLLVGCGNKSRSLERQAVAIPGDAVSASCGMRIAGSPGPRGEVFVDGKTAPLVFGSTRDLMGYVLQPENQARLDGVYVQDSGRIDWRHPSDAASTFIPARKAYYVVWQTLPGAMGPTLATFADMKAAMAFRDKHGGQVLSYKQITPEVVSLLSYQCPKSGSPVAAIAKQCLNGKASGGAAMAPGPDGMMHMGSADRK